MDVSDPDRCTKSDLLNSFDSHSDQYQLDNMLGRAATEVDGPLFVFSEKPSTHLQEVLEASADARGV